MISRIAQNCENWHDGYCEACGVQWQYCEVGADYKCPYFRPRTTPLSHPLANRSDTMTTLSDNARKVYEWARDHTYPTDAGRTIGWNWRAVYRLLELDTADDDVRNMDKQWNVVQWALDELYAAKLLREHYHGPATYGHVSTIFVEKA